MWKRLLIFIFAMLFLGMAVADPTPDFSGVWAADAWSTEPWPVEPPFTPAGKAAQEKWEADSSKDPAHQCIFHLVRITSAPFPHEIIQESDRITVLYEYEHQVRRVFLDERDHPKGTWPTLMGHSIGRIEGNTLIIDTGGVPAGYLRPQAFPHTENLHVVEKHTLIEDGNRKQIEMTIEDPEYYRELWTVTMTWSKTEEEIMDYDCVVREHLTGF